MTKKRIIDNPNEYQECLWFYEWAQLHPIIAKHLIKNVNEGKRDLITGNRLKMIGLRKGLPDYHLPLANDKYIGLWIEMKRRNSEKRKKDEHQDQWIKVLLEAGHYATYAYGWESAAKISADYLSNKL